jgi:predicted DNA-binding transcriptional regulator AlpA
MAAHTPQLLNAVQLSKLLGIPVAQIYRLSGSGQIPRIKFGRRTIRFDPEEVLDAVKSRSAPVQPTARVESHLPHYDWKQASSRSRK